MFRSPLVISLVKLALREDLSFGDITSDLTIPKNSRSSAVILAREGLVVAGLSIIPIIFECMKARVSVRLKQQDGKRVQDGATLAHIEGKTRDLLSAERTILNFLQRISGVATHTRTIVDKGHGITILDTRKTMPGWRMLDKYSVRIGGGTNHRFHLGDLILVKNNHVDANRGDMRATLKGIFAKKPRNISVEVEVRTLQELKIALEFEPQVVMLDNMSDSLIGNALRIIAKSELRPFVEVSGGVNISRLSRLKKLGVEFVSMGSLTTEARNVDISMRIKTSK